MIEIPLKYTILSKRNRFPEKRDSAALVMAVLGSMPVIVKVNHLEKEEYLFYLIQAGIAGCIPMILVWIGLVRFPYPSVICAGISFLVLAGLFIFQKKSTVREFHKKLRM